jgi:phosphosulfolactate synthase (CoM biosynthesis protein A)
LAQATDLLVQNECYVDVWKFGWGIAYLDPQLAAKLETFRLSLRADTYAAWTPGPVPVAGA